MAAVKRSLPGFSRGSSPPPSRAHAFTPSPLGDPLFLLSSRSRLRPRCASRLVSSRRALSLRPLASSRKRTARRPGRSEQLSPAFPSSNSACATRDVPLALPHAILLLSRSLRPSVRSADALSVSPLPRSTQPSLPPFLLITIVPILFSSHLAAPHIYTLSLTLFSFLSRLLPRFSSLSLFSIRWATLLSAILYLLPCYLTGPYTLLNVAKLPFRRTQSLLAGHSLRIEFECVWDAKAGSRLSRRKRITNIEYGNDTINNLVSS